MSEPIFTHDVFLSHSAKDKAVVRALAERLRKDGLRVWFDEWECPSPAGAGEGGQRPGEGRGAEGDSIPAKIEDGLEHSRVLVLCMSANTFGSDWAQMEAGTCGRGNLPFRDPLNQERRFIPLRLDDAPIKGSLPQFLYIKWRPADREQEYAKLLDACQPPLIKMDAAVKAKVQGVFRKCKSWGDPFRNLANKLTGPASVGRMPMDSSLRRNRRNSLCCL